MLLIKTKVKKSKITDAGNGLFTKNYIQEGELVWKTDYDFDTLIHNSDYLALREQGISTLFLDTYATVNPDGTRYLDGDNCIYMNHSKDPNIVFIGRFAFSKRDIPKNTELTCDYETITTPEHFKKLI